MSNSANIILRIDGSARKSGSTTRALSDELINALSSKITPIMDKRSQSF